MDATLAGLRASLDRLNARIVHRLAERARYPACLPLYEPRFGRLDTAFASLERHRQAVIATYPPNAPAAVEEVEPSQRAVTDHYLYAISELCPDGDDLDAYAEIVLLDADVLALILMRISLGIGVAQAKLASAPEIGSAPFDAPRARAALVVPAREAQVIAQAIALGERVGLRTAPVATLFRAIISETTDLELRLIARVAGQAGH